MIHAIVYTSQTGNTKAYAELLSRLTDIPAYPLSAKPEAKEVIFLGWLRAGGIVGLREAEKLWKVPCVCAVGMSPSSQEQVNELRRKNKVFGETQLFYLQGGLDLGKLKGPVKLVLTLIAKSAGKKLAAMKTRTPSEEATYRMTKGPYSCVSEANLKGVVDWCRKQEQAE
jgi:hypothetical protein